MEDKCQLIRGFFVLRPCGREAKVICKQCGKSICRRCESPNESKMCKECYIDTEDYTESWLYTRRRQKYGDTGIHVTVNLNNHDDEAFDPENQTTSESTDWGDEDEISAFDS